MAAAATSLPRVRFIIFHYESGLVLKIVFEKYLFGAPFSPFFFIFHIRALPTEEMEKEHARINGGGCNKLATCLLFIFHYESGLVLKIVFEIYLFVAPFSPFFHFSFSSTSHRRNEQKTRAHRCWRLCQACHVFAFLFSILRVASF